MPLQLFRRQERAPPVERVKELSSHGFSEPEIVDVLRREGYSPKEIDLALTQALKEKLQAPSVPLGEEKKEETKLPTLEEVIRKPQQEASRSSQSPEVQTQQYSWEDYFNYIDYLIHSRISEINKELENFNLKYQTMEKRIEEINQSLRDTLVKRDEAFAQIMKKIEELSSSIIELSTKIAALEEIFKEVLPALIESVRSLTKLVREK
ncbi:MAG: hypothetical protein LM587_01305 [Candidatus Aenigmarchaeota archaeon]|jgi:predicted  nucleic acid-binding Zn-ribbon protein|nr:hypothetical protein [Candidatus Aenigmarchaeota archaeon]